ncbi:hypothetical protein BDZ94DRAFT_1265495 [Collybia nuda]|uniref:Uncharacterized protein n=1 Tax=Collybia nuda TaxID=64659 RepID=A0A9P5Y383_9AGAR|nr:hypothetical protein BDZ94DRAFT_1265495 [Collybia nuda]
MEGSVCEPISKCVLHSGSLYEVVIYQDFLDPIHFLNFSGLIYKNWGTLAVIVQDFFMFLISTFFEFQ